MKLYGKLLISMTAAGALALIVLALALNWRLGQGFVDFINAVDAERLPSIAAAMEEHYRQQGDWQSLRNQPRRWRELLRRARELDEQTADNDAHDPPRFPPPRHRRGDPWTPFWLRLSVFDADKRRVIGRYDYGESAQRLPVVVDGETVGWVGLREVSEVRSRVGESFLADQRQGLLLASLAMILILGLSAAILARAWSRPIERIGRVTRRLAGGDFAARVGSAGHDEIGELARDIDFLAHSLEQAEASRKRWMADAAHELRTPLAVLKGELEAVQDGIRPMDAESLASLHAEATHLGELIEELRELAQADIGALDYRMADVDLVQTVRDSLDASGGRLTQAGLSIELALPSTPLIVRGDPRRLRQLLENLIENALRYTHAGGRLRVRLASERGQARLLFDDTMPGVSDELLPRLFEPFVRGGSARTRAEGGSGLGLAICRRIVEAHGGRIQAEHSELGGLAVRIALPKATEAQP